MARQIWKFHVKEGCEASFIEMNTRDWPGFFRGSPDYRGTTVSMLADAPRVYLTEDYWQSKAAFDCYVAANRPKFEELSALHKELYYSAEHVGFFEDVEFTPGSV